MAIDIDGSQLFDAPDHFDAVAVRFGQGDALAAAGLVEILDPGCALGLSRQFMEVFLAGGVEREADESWIALFGHVEMVARIGAAHKQRVVGALGPHHAEIGQELFLHVQIGRPDTAPSDVGYLDDRLCHWLTPFCRDGQSIFPILAD